MIYKENPNRKVYNIDFDGTITKGHGDHSIDINYSVTDKIKELYYSGNILIIWTARQWCDAPFLVSVLIENNIPFHGIRMDKGGSDYYVDDKNIMEEHFFNHGNESKS